VKIRKISSRLVNFEELNAKILTLCRCLLCPSQRIPSPLFYCGFLQLMCCLKVRMEGSNPGHHNITQSGKTKVINKGKKNPFVVIKEILQER